jgi:hypothetical protein
MNLAVSDYKRHTYSFHFILQAQWERIAEILKKKKDEHYFRVPQFCECNWKRKLRKKAKLSMSSPRRRLGGIEV